MSVPLPKWFMHLGLSATLASPLPSSCLAQDGSVIVVEQAATEQPKQEAIQQQLKEQASSEENGKDEKESKGGEANPADKKDGKPGQEGESQHAPTNKPVTRPTEPEKPFDPRQYEAAKPNPDGEYKLAFVGTPWPPLIQWLGEISGKSVDWRELPGDYLNLQTQRSYSVEEVGDIVNRHLLARGYTILIDVELLTVEKTADINVSLVPRISVEQLESHMPHEFARVLFDLDWLVAEEVAKELKPLVSANGKLTAFAGTNRIEVMDSVRNLQQISEILRQEQSGLARSKLVREFELEHVSAATVRKQLEELMGVKSAGAVQPMTPEQMQQQQQLIQRAQQRGQPPPQQAAQPSGDGKVSFVVNEQRNSVIATAPPDKMAVIVETIALLDVPTGRGDSLDSYLGRMKAYRLVSLNPSEVVAILTETGGLDPTTKLKVDDKSKSIIASAPPWDHLTIQKLIDKLDGSSREFHVLRLRRRRADQVATTIQALMVGEEKKDDSRSNRYYGYYFGNSQKEEKSNDQFRVAADIEHNWILVWCNEIEYEQVLHLLQELGEIPEQGVSASTYRVLQEVPDSEASDFLKRVKEAFEQMAPNAVQIDSEVEETLKEAERKHAEEQKAAEEERKKKAEEEKKRTLPKTQDVRFDTVTAFVQSPSSLSNQSPVSAAPPIRISQDSNGRIVIKSDDPRALDLFEEISAQLMPRPKGFHVFKLKHALSTWVVIKLESFFEDDDDKNDSNRRPYYYFYYGQSEEKEDKKAGLGDQPKIKFVSEMDSNTIVVRNATDSQLKTIEELLKIYDVPEPKDPDRARYTTIYSVKYSRATLISETIKSAFPDLLSKNDQVVQRGNQQNENGNNGRRRGNNGGNGGNDRDEEEERPPSSGGLLLGKLSIGADDKTNTLIVSTEGEQLQKVVMPIIEQLDRAAENADTVKVHALPSGSSAAIAQSLSALLGDGSLGKQNSQSGNQEQGDDERQQRDEQSRRDSERRQRGQDGGQAVLSSPRR